MEDFSTPMMKQYLAIKAQYKDCLLFFRLGDFYELFLDDAQIGATVLNITLTSRPRGKDGRIPMAGVPYHAVDSYLAKLVKAGYKVAICEQMSLPDKRGIVDREVIRIVTPGTVLDENALSKKDNNYIISLGIKDQILALAVADISTGYFATTELKFDNLQQTLADQLAKLNPSECLLSPELYKNFELLKVLKVSKNLNVYSFAEWSELTDRADNYLKKHFKVENLDGFGLKKNSLAAEVAAALIGYLKITQQSQIEHILKIVNFEDRDYLGLDRSTIINLELFSTIRDHDLRGSLLSVIDQTLTPMGGRMIKQWLIKPLINEVQINHRLDTVEVFVNDLAWREGISQMLSQIPDIERLLSRVSVGLGNARDLVNLKIALVKLLEVKQELVKSKLTLIKQINNNLSSKLDKVIELIDTQIAELPPIDLRIGSLIKEGVKPELDKLRTQVSKSRQWVATLEQTERQRTGISSLKVRFNKVFGFYIEVSKSNLNLIPDDYIRKQTLVNGERYITPDLKHHEEIILSAEEIINNLEYELFLEVVKKVLSQVKIIQQAAEAVGTLDCLVGFATLANQSGYTRPNLIKTGQIKITAGRHPVVEQLLEDKSFVPNDIYLDNREDQLLMVTGPNMAGKSVLIRQVALISLMAQIGCFVPAKKAELTIVDQIFVRSGASDVITANLSTFMVEMVETAFILNRATAKSLIIMDEIGRGTSTYDGISLAWAVAEHLIANPKVTPKTLFATHYHELQRLEEFYPQKIKNYSMAVEENGENLNFLHTFILGGASHSFGVAVAKLAGVPQSVIESARQKLKDLEKRDLPISNSLVQNDQADLNSFLERFLYKELIDLDIHQMTPLEALNKLSELKNKLRLLSYADNIPATS